MLNSIDPDVTGAADTVRLYSLAFWLRPRSYWDVVVHHLLLALITGIALLLPYCVTLDRLPQIPCTFAHLTGYPCPFCGFTRSFWAIATGQWGYAFANCPLAFAVYMVAAVMFAWNFPALVFGVIISRGPLPRLEPKQRGKAAALVLLLFLANWVYRISMGLT
jgi:hypothetical protein